MTRTKINRYKFVITLLLILIGNLIDNFVIIIVNITHMLGKRIYTIII